MAKIHFGKLSTLLFAACTLSPFAAAQETSWLELEEGYKGEAIGAKVNRIELPDMGSGQRITVSIPKDAIGNTKNVQEVVVVAKREDSSERLPNTSYTWAQDQDPDSYGLIIKLSTLENYPIRVFLKTDLPLSN